MKTTYKISVIFIISFILMITSCEVIKDKSLNTEQKVRVLEESSISLNTYKDVFNQVNSIAKFMDDTLSGNDTNRNKNGEFPQITITPNDSTTWPKTIIYNYGPVNHLCSDMRERRGIIKIKSTGFFKEPGSELNVSFLNFYQDNYKIEGEQSILNTGFNKDNNLVFDIIVQDGKIHAPDHRTFNFDQNTTREWTVGYDTPNNYQDDEFLLSGTQTGHSSDSVSYNLEIENSEPLSIMVMCRWIRGGIVNINIDGNTDISLDFGNGECDNIAEADINGQKHIIEMN